MHSRDPSGRPYRILDLQIFVLLSPVSAVGLDVAVFSMSGRFRSDGKRAWRTRHARPALDSREIVWASAVINNASACLRWLAAQNLQEARKSASLVIADGHRAGEIIGRIRALAKKAPSQKDWLDPNETIGEVIAMAGSEVRRNHISLQTQLANDLPLILADRIQLQQVILNLLINGIEAMGGVSKSPRELWVARDQRAAIEELRSRFASLTPRERAVMTRVVAGLLNKQIGAELGTSEITVKMHRHQVMEKVGAGSLPELVRMADRLGILVPKS
jgi:DNA-binding NarL/FixJ family response regulator